MKLLLQADARWRADQLGTGKATIGRSGCVLLSVVNAARSYGIDALPRDVPLDCFRGSLLIVRKACRALGMTCVDAIGVVNVAPHQRAIVRVDRTADGVGDHTVLMLGDGTVWCPARGMRALTDFSVVSWRRISGVT